MTPSAPRDGQEGSLPDRFGPLVVAGAFFLSGAAALVYQVSWQRILALQTGVGVYSIALIVAAFLAGLGLGSHLGGVLSARVSPQGALAAFAVLELAISGFGAGSCIVDYDWLHARAAAFQESPWGAGLLPVACLVGPTTLMGMSLPFLTRFVVQDASGAGRVLGLLYGTNALGASLGAVLTPWVLIRFAGIRGAVAAAALLNLAAGLAALLLWRGRARADRPSAAPDSRPPASLSAHNALLRWAALYALSGFVALSLEIVWFRLVDIAAKATAFAFGTVLALYLLGAAAGSLVGAAAVRRIRRPLRAFLLAQCLLLAYSGAAVVLMIGLPPSTPGYSWFFDYWGRADAFMLGWVPDTGTVLRLYLVLPLFLFGPPTVLMGLSFPVLQRAVQDDPATSGRKVGLLQAANIVGCVAGSLVVGLGLLDRVGTTGSLRVLLGCGVAFALIGGRRYGFRGAFGLAGAALVTLVVLLPDGQGLLARLHGVGRDDLLAGEDATGVAALVREGEARYRLFVGGKSHSWLPFGGVHTRLGAMPAILHPAPLDVAVVGLGSGDTAWAAGCRSETRAVTVFELSGPQAQLLVDASRLHAGDLRFASLRTFLADGRYQIRVADGRNALQRGPARYDVIQADALRPEQSLSGTVYSVEFFRLCGRRLKPGGLMFTWAPTPRVRRTFRAAFRHVIEIEDGTFLAGSNEEIPLDRMAWRARLSSPDVQAYFGDTAVTRAVLRGLRSAVRARTVECGDWNLDLFPRDEFLSPVARVP